MAQIFKVKLLHKSDFKNKAHFSVILAKGVGLQEIRDVYVDLKHSQVIENLKDKDFVTLTGCHVNKYGGIYLSADTKVFKTKPFNCEAMERDFYDSPQVSLSEAKDSPRKKRLTIKGTIEDVQHFEQEGQWYRQEVKVKDSVTTTVVKLWNHKRLDESYLDKPVIMKNVEVDLYKDRKELKSTPQTTVELTEEAIETKEVTVLGVCFEKEPYSVLIEYEDKTEELVVDEGQKKKLAPGEGIKIRFLGKKLLEVL